MKNNAKALLDAMNGARRRVVAPAQTNTKTAKVPHTWACDLCGTRIGSDGVCPFHGLSVAKRRERLAQHLHDEPRGRVRASCNGCIFCERVAIRMLDGGMHEEAAIDATIDEFFPLKSEEKVTR